MTPSKQAKEYGLDSITQASKLSGVSVHTLRNWLNNKPDLFDVVMRGCLDKAKS